MYRISCPISQAPGARPTESQGDTLDICSQGFCFHRAHLEALLNICSPCELIRRTFHPHHFLLILKRWGEKTNVLSSSATQTWNHTPAASVFSPLRGALTAWPVPAAGPHDTLSHHHPNLMGQSRAALGVGSATKIQNCCCQPRTP